MAANYISPTYNPLENASLADITSRYNALPSYLTETKFGDENAGAFGMSPLGVRALLGYQEGTPVYFSKQTSAPVLGNYGLYGGYGGLDKTGGITYGVGEHGSETFLDKTLGKVAGGIESVGGTAVKGIQSVGGTLDKNMNWIIPALAAAVTYGAGSAAMGAGAAGAGAGGSAVSTEGLGAGLTGTSAGGVGATLSEGPGLLSGMGSYGASLGELGTTAGLGAGLTGTSAGGAGATLTEGGGLLTGTGTTGIGIQTLASELGPVAGGNAMAHIISGATGGSSSGSFLSGLYGGLSNLGGSAWGLAKSNPLMTTALLSTLLGTASGYAANSEEEKRQKQYQDALLKALAKTQDYGALRESLKSEAAHDLEAQYGREAAAVSDRGTGGGSFSRNIERRKRESTEAINRGVLAQIAANNSNTGLIDLYAKSAVEPTSAGSATLGGLSGSLGTIAPYLAILSLMKK